MFLYLVQHGESKSKEEDSERPLSDKGLSNIKDVTDYISKLNITVTEIFHSNKLRAKQTAEVLHAKLKPAKGLAETEGLAPMDDPDIWSERLKNVHEDIILVGHLPHLGKLASLLLSGDMEKNIVSFRMAGIACLKRDESNDWTLQWMITPEILAH